VIDLRAEEVEAPPSFGTRVKADYLLGMARYGKKFCLMLDTDKVLSSEELLDLNDAGESSVANEDEAILDIEPTSPVQDEATGA